MSYGRWFTKKFTLRVFLCSTSSNTTERSKTFISFKYNSGGSLISPIKLTFPRHRIIFQFPVHVINTPYHPLKLSHFTNMQFFTGSLDLQLWDTPVHTIVWFLYRSTQAFQWCSTSLSTALTATPYVSIRMAVVYFAGPKFFSFWLLVLNLGLFNLVVVIVFPLYCLLWYRSWGSFFPLFHLFCASQVTDLWLILKEKEFRLSCTLMWVSMVKVLVPCLRCWFLAAVFVAYGMFQSSIVSFGMDRTNKIDIVWYSMSLFSLLVWFYFLPCFINVVSAFVGL